MDLSLFLEEVKMKKIPVMIDTDPGVDDFFCLAVGSSFPEIIDLKAVSTIGGNNYTSVTTRNALDILHLFHRDDVEVAAGETSFLTEPFGEPVAKFHGANGIGDVEIEHTTKKEADIKGSEMIYKVAKENAGELILVPVGPLTNIARVILDHPDVVTMIKKIVLMGGSITRGNITPYAEANIGHDVPAADIVFKSGIPIDMVGLNVTLASPLPREVFDPMCEGCDKTISDTVKALIDFRKGEPMHDAVAISSLIDETLTFRKARVTIELDGEKRGQTVADFDAPDEEKNVRVAVEVHLDRYYGVIDRVINSYTA